MSHLVSSWSQTAVEYAVFVALGIHGYSDISPQAGYANHPCMVPVLDAIKDGQCDQFCDFSVISDPELCFEYVVKTLAQGGIGVEFTTENGPLVTLTNGERSVSVPVTQSFERGVCEAVLAWFDVTSVPEWVVTFDKDCADFLNQIPQHVSKDL